MAFALVPLATLSAFGPRRGKTASTPSYINRVFVFIPDGKSIADANQELRQWANEKHYKTIVDQFKADGRLIDYTITRTQNPFTIELVFPSREARQSLIDELAAHRIFNDEKRIAMGYTMSEDLQAYDEHGNIGSLTPVRVRT